MATLLTELEAAESLGVSPRTLANWRSRGGGPVFVRLGGKAIRYHTSDLAEFVEECRRRHTSEYEDEEDEDDFEDGDEEDDFEDD